MEKLWLCDDVLGEVFRFLRFQEIVQMQSVNKRWLAIGRRSYLWKDIVISHVKTHIQKKGYVNQDLLTAWEDREEITANAEWYSVAETYIIACDVCQSTYKVQTCKHCKIRACARCNPSSGYPQRLFTLGMVDFYAGRFSYSLNEEALKFDYAPKYTKRNASCPIEKDICLKCQCLKFNKRCCPGEFKLAVGVESLDRNFDFLSIKEIARVQRVNKRWKRCATKNKLWKRVLCREFPDAMGDFEENREETKFEGFWFHHAKLAVAYCEVDEECENVRYAKCYLTKKWCCAEHLVDVNNWKHTSKFFVPLEKTIMKYRTFGNPFFVCSNLDFVENNQIHFETSSQFLSYYADNLLISFLSNEKDEYSMEGVCSDEVSLMEDVD